MKILRTIWSGIRSLLKRQAVKREIDEELRFHIEQRTAENIAAGMPPEDAAREARKRFGNMQSVREDCRDVRGASFGEAAFKDVRFALRMLGKNPGFTAMAVLTLGLGIGAASTLFGVCDALVISPFPYPRPDRIAYVWSNNGQPLSMPDFLDIRKQDQSFSDLGVYTPPLTFNLGSDPPARAYACRCTAGVLRTFGMPPAPGEGSRRPMSSPGPPPSP